MLIGELKSFLTDKDDNKKIKIIIFKDLPYVNDDTLYSSDNVGICIDDDIIFNNEGKIS